MDQKHNIRRDTVTLTKDKSDKILELFEMGVSF